MFGTTASASGYGVYSNGDCRVTGDLTVDGAKAFEVDHPLDPANRYLRHYCTEGAEALTQYSGNVTLDARGGAEVVLPEWFEGLNDEVRYQLTPIGTAMADLHVAAKVSRNRFRIAGGPARGEVSWLLTCRRRGIDRPVEVDKPTRERGTYVNPDLYGQPASASLRQRELAAATRKPSDATE